MQGNPRGDREWEHWPGRKPPDEGIRHRLKALFAATDDEEAVDALISDRGREIEEQTERLQQTIESLERREEQAARLRSAVEEMLRHGSAELDERQAELAALAIELRAREEAVREQERDVALRKQELGAVELRRAAVERREADGGRARVGARAGGAGSARPGAASSPSASARSVGSDLARQRRRSPRRRRTCSTSRATAGGSSSATAPSRRSMPPSSVDGEALVVTRVGRSPLPGDPRALRLSRACPRRRVAPTESSREPQAQRRRRRARSPSASIRRPAWLDEEPRERLVLRREPAQTHVVDLDEAP